MDFLQVLADANIPTTAEALKTRFRQLLADSGSRINNDDAVSPFWRFVSAAITEPVLWLVNFIAATVLPQSYVKYATGEFLDLLADAVNLTRKPAGKLVGTVQFSRTDSGLSITIPVGTVIQTASIFGVVYRVQVTQQTSFAGDSLTVLVPVQAVEVGAAYNLPVGYYAVLAVPMAGISAVANVEGYIAVPGTDQETDDDLRARVRNQFNTAANYHTDAVYKGLIGTFSGVDINNVWFVHDAPRGPGTADAYVLFDFSADASAYLTAINAYITDQGNHGHGDDLQVFQLPTEDQALTLTVYVPSYMTTTEKNALKADIETFINAAFRENTVFSPTLTRPFSRFSLSKLSAELHSQFPLILSIDFVQEDIATDLFVPRLTTLTVTMAVLS